MRTADPAHGQVRHGIMPEQTKATGMQLHKTEKTGARPLMAAPLLCEEHSPQKSNFVFMIMLWLPSVP
jgi:hypothetical protein